MARKGSNYERSFCRDLSSWWAPGRDDIFWRSSGSGGRAKGRGRRGHQTHGQHGDVCATDPIGEPFTRLFTVELKRGLSKFTIIDLVDRPKKNLPKLPYQKYEQWFKQVRESQEQAGTSEWLLIHKRDMRQPLFVFSNTFFKAMRKLGTFDPMPTPFAFFQIKCEGELIKAWATTQEVFFSEVSPADIRLMLLGRAE